MTCNLRSSETVIVQNSHLLMRSSFQEICDFPPWFAFFKIIPCVFQSMISTAVKAKGRCGIAFCVVLVCSYLGIIFLPKI